MKGKILVQNRQSESREQKTKRYMRSTEKMATSLLLLNSRRVKNCILTMTFTSLLLLNSRQVKNCILTITFTTSLLLLNSRRVKNCILTITFAYLGIHSSTEPPPPLLLLLLSLLPCSIHDWSAQKKKDGRFNPRWR